MAMRINRCVELLAQDQAIYYVGGHTGHVLTYEQGCADARTWADYINVGMEHGAFDMAGLAAYMQGLVDGGPTGSGHRTPTVIVEAPVNGTDAAQCALQRLAAPPDPGARGAWDPAVPGGVRRCRARVCRVVPLPASTGGRRSREPISAGDRLRGAPSKARLRMAELGVGTRGRGSEPTAAPIWGLEPRSTWSAAIRGR